MEIEEENLPAFRQAINAWAADHAAQPGPVSLGLDAAVTLAELSLSLIHICLVSNVTLYGPAAEIEELSADSIVAQIDCQSLNLTVGQQTIAVSIQIPSSSCIFATGSYTVQCEVTSK